MANYTVTDSELTGLANHIRTKNGSQAQIQWPTGYESAVDALNAPFVAADAGKVVVSNGSGGYELQAQASQTITDNGTYDTTNKNSVTVAIPAAAGNSY